MERSSGGRPGRRDRPRRRLRKKSWCHRARVSGRTRKLLHRSRVSTRAAAARNARSAVVKRGRVPPRRRIFSWWRSTAVSRSSSSTPQRWSRRSSRHRSRYLKDHSIGASLMTGRPADEQRGESADRVSLPHRNRRSGCESRFRTPSRVRILASPPLGCTGMPSVPRSSPRWRAGRRRSGLMSGPEAGTMGIRPARSQRISPVRRRPGRTQRWAVLASQHEPPTHVPRGR